MSSLRRGAGPVVLGLSVALALPACGGPTSPVASPTTTATSTLSTPAGPATATTSTSGPPPVSSPVTLAVVRCPTQFAPATAPTTSAPLPARVTVGVPIALAGTVAVYGDSAGLMELVAPTGWTCRADYGADGSGGIVVVPAGESVPDDWGAGWRLAAGSPVEAVVGSESAACAGCTVGQACPLFSAAAEAFVTEFGARLPRIVPLRRADRTDRLGDRGLRGPSRDQR